MGELMQQAWAGPEAKPLKECQLSLKYLRSSATISPPREWESQGRRQVPAARRTYPANVSERTGMASSKHSARCPALPCE